MRARAIGVGMALLALLAACERGDPDLDVRTFKLQHIEPEAAQRIVQPYIMVATADVTIDNDTRTITVRETPEMLERIERVLTEFDRANPTVTLHFQLIMADGAGGAGADPRIAEVESALRDLFRFESYRLASEALVRGSEWSDFRQMMDARRTVEGRIRDIRAGADDGTVNVQVGLFDEEHGAILHTGMNANLGQTIVLGTSQPERGSGALILTLRAEVKGG